MAADPFMTLWMAGASQVRDGKLVTDQGSSWVQLVEYDGDTVHAKTILPYGNSNNVNSPHYSDQVRLFARRKLKTALLTREAIEAHAIHDVTLVR